MDLSPSPSPNKRSCEDLGPVITEEWLARKCLDRCIHSFTRVYPLTGCPLSQDAATVQHSGKAECSCSADLQRIAEGTLHAHQADRELRPSVVREVDLLIVFPTHPFCLQASRSRLRNSCGRKYSSASTARLLAMPQQQDAARWV